MDETKFDRLTNALLSAYLNESSAEAIVKICADFNIAIGDKIFRKACDRVTEMMSPDSGLDGINMENRRKITEIGIREICKKHGAVLGVDISKTPNGVMMSAELLDKIAGDFPPGHFDRLRAQGMLKTMTDDPYSLLDQHLRVPFFETLLSRIVTRIESLTDTDAALYLNSLCGGMVAANSFLDDPFWYSKIMGCCGDRGETIGQILMGDTCPDTTLDLAVLIFDDLFAALGITGEDGRPIADDGSLMVSVADLKLLDKVWHGSDRRPALVAEMMERSTRGRGFGK